MGFKKSTSGPSGASSGSGAFEGAYSSATFGVRMSSQVKSNWLAFYKNRIEDTQAAVDDPKTSAAMREYYSAQLKDQLQELDDFQHGRGANGTVSGTSTRHTSSSELYSGRYHGPVSVSDIKAIQDRLSSGHGASVQGVVSGGGRVSNYNWDTAPDYNNFDTMPKLTADPNWGPFDRALNAGMTAVETYDKWVRNPVRDAVSGAATAIAQYGYVPTQEEQAWRNSTGVGWLERPSERTGHGVDILTSAAKAVGPIVSGQTARERTQQSNWKNLADIAWTLAPYAYGAIVEAGWSRFERQASNISGKAETVLESSGHDFSSVPSAKGSSWAGSVASPGGAPTAYDAGVAAESAVGKTSGTSTPGTTSGPVMETYAVQQGAWAPVTENEPWSIKQSHGSGQPVEYWQFKESGPPRWETMPKSTAGPTISGGRHGSPAHVSPETKADKLWADYRIDRAIERAGRVKESNWRNWVRQMEAENRSGRPTQGPAPEWATQGNVRGESRWQLYKGQYESPLDAQQRERRYARVWEEPRKPGPSGPPLRSGRVVEGRGSGRPGSPTGSLGSYGENPISAAWRDIKEYVRERVSPPGWERMPDTHPSGPPSAVVSPGGPPSPSSSTIADYGKWDFQQHSDYQNWLAGGERPSWLSDKSTQTSLFPSGTPGVANPSVESPPGWERMPQPQPSTGLPDYSKYYKPGVIQDWSPRPLYNADGSPTSPGGSGSIGSSGAPGGGPSGSGGVGGAGSGGGSSSGPSGQPITGQNPTDPKFSQSSWPPVATPKIDLRVNRPSGASGASGQALAPHASGAAAVASVVSNALGFTDLPTQSSPSWHPLGTIGHGASPFARQAADGRHMMAGGPHTHPEGYPVSKYMDARTIRGLVDSAKSKLASGQSQPLAVQNALQQLDDYRASPQNDMNYQRRKQVIRSVREMSRPIGSGTVPAIKRKRSLVQLTNDASSLFLGSKWHV